jgi:hypothetical protein
MNIHRKTTSLSFLFLIIFLFVPIAGAVSNVDKVSNNPDTGEELFEEMRENAELYNQYFDNGQIPTVKKLVSGISEDILVKIKLDNGKTLSVTFTANKGKIDLDTFSMDNEKSKFKPSITVKTDEETVREVIDSKDLTEILKFMTDGSIKMNTKSYSNEIESYLNEIESYTNQIKTYTNKIENYVNEIEINPNETESNQL